MEKVNVLLVNAADVRPQTKTDDTELQERFEESVGQENTINLVRFPNGRTIMASAWMARYTNSFGSRARFVSEHYDLAMDADAAGRPEALYLHSHVMEACLEPMSPTQPPRVHAAPAIESNAGTMPDFLECRGTEIGDALERVRFFCALALSETDWLAAEGMFAEAIQDREDRKESSQAREGEVARLLHNLEEAEVGGRTMEDRLAALAKQRNQADHVLSIWSTRIAEDRREIAHLRAEVARLTEATKA
jgi:hypothetical protein